MPKASSTTRAIRFCGGGEHALTAAEVAKVDPNYLMDELPKRIAAGPVKFRLWHKSPKRVT